MKVPYGYLSRQYNTEIAEKIWREYVKPVVERGDFTLGKEVERFEKAFAHMHRADFCLGVGNGTDALEIALELAEHWNESEVIVPVNTFIATAASVARSGAKLVFCDTNEKFVMDHNKISDLLSGKTGAILPVHFQGQPCSMPVIMEIAEKHDLVVIEDAAQAANASIDDKYCGTWGSYGCFSFHPQKNMNCWGDGGAIFFDSYSSYGDGKLLRNHGMMDRDHYSSWSRNSRLDTIHAAVLLHDIKLLQKHNDRRIAIARRYDDELPLLHPPRDDNERHTYHLYMTIVPDMKRDRLLEHLILWGVDAKVHYPVPLHLQPCAKDLDYGPGDFPMAEFQAKNMISLPIHQFMTDQEVDYVIAAVKSFYE